MARIGRRLMTPTKTESTIWHYELGLITGCPSCCPRPQSHRQLAGHRPGRKGRISIPGRFLTGRPPRLLTYWPPSLVKFVKPAFPWATTTVHEDSTEEVGATGGMHCREVWMTDHRYFTCQFHGLMRMWRQTSVVCPGSTTNGLNPCPHVEILDCVSSLGSGTWTRPRERLATGCFLLHKRWRAQTMGVQFLLDRNWLQLLHRQNHETDSCASDTSSWNPSDKHGIFMFLMLAEGKSQWKTMERKEEWEAWNQN